MSGGILGHEDLLALVENAKELSSEIDLSDLLHKILERAGQLTDSPSASFIVKDGEQEGFYFAAAIGPVAPVLLETMGETAQKRIPESSNAGRVYRSGETLVEHAVKNNPDHYKGVDQETKHQTESMICVPLIVGNERIGVVQLLNKATGNYMPRDVALLEHFAAHAAVAIRNARIFRDLLAHKGLFTSTRTGKKTGDLLRELNAPAQRRPMTVAFADMRGFTRLSNTLGDPVRIEQHLNEFLTLLATQVMRYDGLVNKFLGDGVLALFRDDNAELRAVRCAFSIVEEFLKLRETWNKRRAEHLGFLDVGVGIATGEVTIGSVGSGRVKDFTVLGNPVNLAAAFEGQARNGVRVLVDQITYNAVREIVAEGDELAPFELKKPDQPSGIEYKRYHIRRLRPESGEPTVTVTEHASSHPLRAGDLGPYYNDSWAVVVGVDRFKSRDIERLQCAVADANAVAEALPKIGFQSDHIEVLRNENASKQAIMRAIYGKLSSTNREDRLLIFFALHGQMLKQHKGEEGYLLPYDADPLNLPLSALPMSELTQIGKRLPPKHILFVLDTCFSGYATKRGMATGNAQTDLRVLTREHVVQLLCAGTAGQQAIEEEGHGIFTRNFLKGLEGWADPDGGGLTALKLLSYIQERVVARSEGRQMPQYAKLDGEGEFLFLPPRK